MTTLNRRYTFDVLTQLKDAGLIAATGNATVGGSAKVLDLGTGRVDSRVIIDLTALEIDTGDEVYTIQLQGSNALAFGSSVVNIAEKKLGKAALTGESVDSTLGRYEMPFSNDVDGVLYEFVRIHVIVVGTIATGINFTAFLAKS